jgi:hypothetical protein
MTLRILDAMVRGRREQEGWYTANIIRYMPFANPTPESVNPWHSIEKSPALVELEKWQAKRRWQLMFGQRTKRRMEGR